MDHSGKSGDSQLHDMMNNIAEPEVNFVFIFVS